MKNLRFDYAEASLSASEIHLRAIKILKDTSFFNIGF